MNSKIAYIPQQYNPKKHPDMPDGYPWTITYIDNDEYIPADNEVLLTLDEYNSYVQGIDLSGYYLSLTKSSIGERIKYYQSIASELIIELYTKNIMSGMSNAQSDALFDELSDVLTRIKEGAFPTAIYRLQNKIPEGYITQPMLDDWIATITSKLL